MKPGPSPQPDLQPLLAFGAHPDDVEFSVGAVIAKEARAGRPVHLVVCSRGESASHGTPEQRRDEAEKAASLLGASLEVIDLDGDAHLEIRAAHAIALARIIRRIRPGTVLAPSLAQNQHPDHWRLGTIVRDACRLARYGGLTELRDVRAHAIEQLLFYAMSPETEPTGVTPLLVDVSDEGILATWRSAMESHASQVAAREYVEYQLTRARLNGLRAGIGHAIPLFPNDPLLVDSLSQLARSARRF
jgi:LmbE family N-acetylglucosaminyl deacetylase